MEKIRLEVVGMHYSQSQSGAYALILAETEGDRRLPIVIGGFEAQAIAIELEKIKPVRPLTHDLFKSFAERYGIILTEVIINRFYEGVFYSQLVLYDGDKIEEVDSRTSDAVALALRFNCPIYVYENVMQAAGVHMDDISKHHAEAQDEPDEDSMEDMDPGSDMGIYSMKELNEQLSKAIENEDYELASKIRDEINKRAKSGR